MISRFLARASYPDVLPQPASSIDKLEVILLWGTSRFAPKALIVSMIPSCSIGARPDALAESINGHFRSECRDQHVFASREEVRKATEARRIEYNTEQTHRALGQRTPAAKIEE